MKRLIIFSILVSGFWNYTNAQKSLPFEMQKMHVKMPADLPSLQKDSLAMRADYLEYDLTGMEIKDTMAYELRASGKTDRSTPWLILQELLGAYQTGKIENVAALYTKESQARIKQFLSTKQLTDQYLATVKKETFMRPYFIMEYDNGLIAFIETTPGRAERFRFEKVKNEYMLAAYEEKSIAMVNNLFSYYFYHPLPHLAADLTKGFDSATVDETPLMTFHVKRPGDWITIFLPVQGYATLLAAQDNGLNDGDPTPGSIKMLFFSSKFPPNTYELNMVESNYPLMSTSNMMISASSKLKVKIKP